MARSASPAKASSPSSSASYVSWDEVAVFNGSGSKEIHYFLKRLDGRADLAVVAKEKTSFRMSYRYVLRKKSTAVGKFGAMMKRFETRDEVIDWLNSITSGLLPQVYVQDEKAVQTFKRVIQGSQFMKSCTVSKDFSWVGSPWTCSNMLRHFPSYRRHGIKIPVNSFVYVLAEENKRLVANIEDLYEDSRGNRMATVRWFHKIDEVDSPLPRSPSDGEILFSLSLQDLSIECIDGLATVVSPHHFEKCRSIIVSAVQEIFVCQHLFEDDEIKPFDITRVKGYWNQELIRQIFSFPPPKAPPRSRQFYASKEMEQNADDTACWTRPRKKQRRLDSDVTKKQNGLEELSAFEHHQLNTDPIENLQQHFSVGCEVEVLCQDSGVKGCWFRASILKIRKDKVKVRYQDIQDAVDEAKKLEEWVSSCKVATPDEYGVRAAGRKTIRPSLQSAPSRSLTPVGVGTSVDVWRYDGWWEGIVIEEKEKGMLSVYFPGVKQESVIPIKDLRVSQDWFESKWIPVLQKADVVSKIVSSLGQTKESMVQVKHSPPRISELPRKEGGEVEIVSAEEEESDPGKLKWKSFRKRSSCRRGSSVVQKKRSNNKRDESSRSSEKKWGHCIKMMSPFVVDTEKCKFIGESGFNSSVVPAPTNLVMSR